MIIEKHNSVLGEALGKELLLYRLTYKGKQTGWHITLDGAWGELYTVCPLFPITA